VSQLGLQIWKILKARDLKQREMADLLGIEQPEVSHLTNEAFSRFSEGKASSNDSNRSLVVIVLR
jgi:predicted XRE-type DNA-binding protein